MQCALRSILFLVLIIAPWTVGSADETVVVLDVPEVAQPFFGDNALFPADEAPQTVAPELEREVAQGCCRYCCQGKPCGNSCIRRSYTCHQPPGCACWGC